MLKTFALCATLGAAATGALAQVHSDIQANPDKSGYLQDVRGVIARSPFGLCWRMGDWSAADAVPGCDGALMPPVAKPTAPEIVSPIAAPSPVAPVAPQRCDFSLALGSDEAFSFNKATLNTSARKRIDEDALAQLAHCANIDTITVTGYTDHLGSRQYNQKLSEKRANAVAAYLRSKGVSAQIDTIGAGETQPVQACANKLPRTKLIECLAPNRRVVIKAHGLAK